jgi:hypothetical protein
MFEPIQLRPDEADVRVTPLSLDSDLEGEFAELLALWRSKCRAGGLPSRADVQPAEVKSMLPRLLFIEVRRHPPDFRYRLTGTGSRDIHGVELTGRSVLDIRPAEHGRRLWNDLCRICADHQPQFLRLQFINQEGSGRSYRVMRLPLAADGVNVDNVIVLNDFDQMSAIEGRVRPVVVGLYA